MTTTLTYGATTVTPVLVNGWEQFRDGRNTIHPRIDGNSIDVTLRAPMPRRGSLSLIFGDEADALAAEKLHIDSPYVDLASDLREIANGRYVVDGRIALALDATRTAWVLTVDFREVPS